MTRASLFALWALVFTCSFFIPGCSDNTDVKLDDIFDYLGEAKSMIVLQTSFDADTRRADNKTILQTSEKTKIESFLEILKNELIANNAETSIKRMEVFTPDYKVELACKRFAAIEFIFFEDTNAVCLRNEDYFFFAELNTETTETLKDYFKSLN
jgi:hypothetical protein